MIDESHNDEVRKKSKVVTEYNNIMQGVNRMDKHLTNYFIIKKRRKKYSFTFYDISLWNAFVLYSKHGGKYSHLNKL